MANAQCQLEGKKVIQVAVVGNPEAAVEAARKGFAVLGLEKELDRTVSRYGTFILYGRERGKLTVFFKDPVEAASKMVDSSDIVIIGGGKMADLVKSICLSKGKPFVEGTGKDVVDKVKEKLVRFNLFGVK